MWGLIKTEVSKGWFVPSRGEWAAFGGELGISTDYESVGLSGSGWSSSQYDTDIAYYADFYFGFMNGNGVLFDDYVRLTTTF